MIQINSYGDSRVGLSCLHCGKAVKGSRDHVPSKVFLDEPYPEDLPVIEICGECNQSFSLDEEYVACFLECIVCGSTVPDNIARPKVREILERKPKLKTRIQNAKMANQSPDSEQRPLWVPEQDRIKNVILKMARGHALYELHEEILGEPAILEFGPLEFLSDEDRNAFETPPSTELWPEVGSRYMQRLITGIGMEDGWINVQPQRYRYLVSHGEPVIIRMVIRDYLAAEVGWERYSDP